MFNYLDDYDKLKPVLDQYIKTGTTKTPDKGRGHRQVKKTPRYEDDSQNEYVDDDEVLRVLLISH